MERRVLLKLLLLAILLLALLVRAYPQREYFGWDESAYMQYGERIAFAKDNYFEAFRPPIVPILLAGVFLVWHSPIAAGLLVALLSSLIALGVYLIGARVHSDEGGLAAAFLVAIHPAFVEVGSMVLTDAIVATVFSFAIWLALDRRWWAALLAGLCAGVGGLTKFTGLAGIVVLGAFLFYEDLREWRWRATIYSLGAVAILAPYLLWSKLTQGGWLVTIIRARTIIPSQGEGPLYYLALISVPMVIGIGLAIWRSKRIDTRFALILSGWLVLIFGYLSWIPHKEPRYGLLAILPLFVLAGIGWSEGFRAVPYKKTFCAAGVFIALLFCAPAFAHLSDPAYNTWLPPSVDAAQHIPAGVRVYATSYYSVFGYYTRDTVETMEGPDFLRYYPGNMPRDGYLVINKENTMEPTVSWAEAQSNMERVYENSRFVLYKYTVPADRWDVPVPTSLL